MKPLHFAFVACNRNAARFREDPSFIYRCENMAAALEAAGHRVTLLHLKSLPLFGRFDVAVLHRPRWSTRLALSLSLLRRRRTVLVADFDDLVFEAGFAEASPGVVNGLVCLETTRKNFQAAGRALHLFDRITVSTEPLAAYVRRRLPSVRIEVVPNAVHLAWRQAAEPKSPVAQTLPVLTYFPGTRSHDRDFAMIAGALERFLKKHPEASLQVTGPLKLSLSTRPGQLVHRGKVPFSEYHRHFQGGWVNLAPLEDTPFNLCKSALKVLEAGYWNIPTICSPTPDALRFAAAGALPAVGEDAWLNQLESMLDPELYQRVSTGLRERVLQVAQVEDCANSLIAFVNEVA